MSQQPDPTTVTVAPAVTVGTTPAVVATTPTTVAAAVTSQAVYTAGDGGTVTLDTTGDVLTIVTVAPTDGLDGHQV